MLTLNRWLVLWVRVIVALLAVLCYSAPAALGQCTLTSPDSWGGGTSNDWNLAGNWSGGKPSASKNTCIITTTNNPVMLSATGAVKNLQLGSSNTLDINGGGTLSVNGANIFNAGTINLTGAGSAAVLNINAGNVSLSSGGTLALSFSSGGSATLNVNVGSGKTFDSNNTISGEGTIDILSGTFKNDGSGTIDATGNALTIENGNVTNNGLMEATGSGVLQLSATTINNGAGTIKGDGGTVWLSGGTDIQGGTLKTHAGGTLGTLAGSTATLDGTTNAVTINGTYTGDVGSTTSLNGSITNNGTLQVNGSTNLNVIGNVTLTGGGTVNLNGSGASLSLSGGVILTNSDNVIQGNGVIYNNAATASTLSNSGAIVANSGTLTIQNENGGTGGIVTNSGALAVDSGGNTLHLVGGSLSNFSGGTLTGGYYLVAGTNANPGTLQIDALGTAGGEIVTNAATIVLSGKGSNLEDANGNNALSNLATNTGSLIIENGRNFTTSGSFTNNGTLDVGNNSTFSTPGAGNRFDNAGTVDIVSNGTLTARGYNQSAGTTTVDGMLTAKGGSGNVRITGGTVLGVGVIDGNVYVRGTGILQPGDAGSTGVMTTTGNYSSKGTLDEDLAGLTAGTQYGQLSVGGTSTLLSGSTLDVNEIDGFEAVSGDEFTILTAAGGESGTFTNLNFSDAPLPTGDYWWVSYGPNQIDLHVATPEPPVWMLLAVGLIIFVAYGMKKNLRSAKLSA